MKRTTGENNRLPIFTKRFRELQGECTNTEFADLLGISRQTVGFYCNGDRIPDAVVLRQIAEKCGVSADWLLGISETPSLIPDIKKVCFYTGLTESAVVSLNTRKEFLSSFLPRLVSTIIENESIGDICGDIGDAASIEALFKADMNLLGVCIESAENDEALKISLPKADIVNFYRNRAINELTSIVKLSVDSCISELIEKLHEDPHLGAHELEKLYQKTVSLFPFEVAERLDKS